MSRLVCAFWVTKSAGSSAAATTWKIHDGSYRVVVMNVDGSAGIDVDGRFGPHVAHLTAIARSLLGGGPGVLLLGVSVLVLGLRSQATSAPVAMTPQSAAVTL